MFFEDHMEDKFNRTLGKMLQRDTFGKNQCHIGCHSQRTLRKRVFANCTLHISTLGNKGYSSMHCHDNIKDMYPYDLLLELDSISLLLSKHVIAGCVQSENITTQQVRQGKFNMKV